MRKLNRNYMLQCLLIIILFLTFIFINDSVKNFLAIFLIIYAILLHFTIRKNKVISIKSNQVTILMIAMAIIGLTIFYLLGLYFGFAKSNIKFSLWSIWHFILPITIIIISSEIIRYKFSMQNTKTSKILNVISMVLIDMTIYTQIYDITVLNDFLYIIGFIFFASISNNLLFEYMSPKYGYKPIIFYRIIMGIYSYIIPVVPNVEMFIRSVLRMFYPFIIYLILELLFAKKGKAKEVKQNTKNYIFAIFVIILSILLSMLISCKFKYGIIVVGSGSMTGTLNVGDATVFVQYKSQEINKGDILIFEKNNTNVIHRVVDIVKVGSENRYYTKGDYNQNIDNGYITEKDIVGICKLKIKYIGYPSLWIKKYFINNN